MSDSPALRARLSGQAARYARLLRDFGHLDSAALSELYLEAAAEAEDSGEVLIDLATMRRIAARHLFVRGAADLRAGRGILAEDWPLLFS